MKCNTSWTIQDTILYPSCRGSQPPGAQTEERLSGSSLLHLGLKLLSSHLSVSSLLFHSCFLGCFSAVPSFPLRGHRCSLVRAFSASSVWCLKAVRVPPRLLRATTVHLEPPNQSHSVTLTSKRLQDHQRTQHESIMT